MTNTTVATLSTAVQSVEGVVLRDSFSHLPWTEGIHIGLPNGWGASIVRGSGTYGGDSGLFEAMAIHPSGDLHGEPLGWLSVEDVMLFVSRVAQR